jgi:hypothetical protein
MRKYLNIIAAVFILAIAVLPLGCRTPPSPDNNNAGNRAAIIDQLYLRQPNSAFIAETTRILESHGFSVDVWQGAQITVDFYRKLPSLGYKLILLRVHSGLLISIENGKETQLDTTYLFTAENYTTTRYVAEQLTDKVSNAMMEADYPLVFAVNSEFIKGANGNFDHTIVLAMGCESYEYDDLPQAFIAKGASMYVGWSNVVTLEYADSVTLDLLNNLCSDNTTLAQGISRTITDLGRDPYFDSFLRCYPAESENMTINELIQK